MAWIEVERKRRLDGCSIIVGRKRRTHFRSTSLVINNRSPSWRSNSIKRRNCSRESRGGNGIDDDGILRSFSNEPCEEFCPNFESAQPEFWRSCRRGGRKAGESKQPTLSETDNVSSICHTPPSHLAAFTVRNSKRCNQLLPPLSSSSSSSSPSSPSSSWLMFLLVFCWNLSSTSSFCPPYCSCDDIALSVDCHAASNLRVVPIFLNPQIKFLSLSKNQIKDITMSLQFYSELQVLDISQNRLDSLGKTNFDSLRSLQLLNASFNSVKALETGVFTGLTQMRVVDLSSCQLERVEAQVFSSLTSVREIILDRNRLEFLDWDLFRGLDTLERISAKFNFIQVIEPSPSFSLSSGDIGGAVVSGLTSNNGNNSNHHTNGPAFVDSSPPAEAKRVASWTLKSVRYLDISSNQLTRVKDYGLVIFGALEELNLCCNYIHTLEEKAFLISPTPGSGGHLERVNLSQNRLGRVPTESLEKLGSLRQLDLSSNRISDHIPKNAFKGLPHLEAVRLSDNPEILHIDPDALAENSKLINFEADYLSNLTEISPTLLRKKRLLENFSLKYASISALSSDFFQHPIADSVGALDLTGNPVDCNCSAHSFYEFVTEYLADSSSSSLSPSPYDFDHSMRGGFKDENNNVIRENAFRSSPPNDDEGEEKSNSSSRPGSESSISNPNLISQHHSTPSRSRSRSFYNNNLSNNNNQSPRPNLLYVRCQSPSNLAGVLVKDLKPSDFEHCFTPDDQFQIMVICIAAGILSLIFLTLAIKLCCVCGAFRRLSSFCKTHCSTANCCQLKARKEKQSSDKLFFDSMTIALRRDLAPVAPPPNFNANIPNGKSIQGEHPATQLLYCGNGSSIPLTASGCVIGGGNGGTLGRNGNGNNAITMSIEYDDDYQDEDDDDDDESTGPHQQLQHQPKHPPHRSQHYGHRDQLECCYPPVEPPPPIPIPLQFPNQVQSLSRKQQQKHQQLLLHHGHQHHSPTMGYSPKHYPLHHQHSPKHSQQQQQHNPPVIVHYEYPDFPSMHRVKQVPSVLV